MREASFPSSRLLLTHRRFPPGIRPPYRDVECLAEQAYRILLPMIFDELVPHNWLCEKMAKAFFQRSRSFCVLSSSRLSRRSSSRFRALMPTPWEPFFAMFGHFLAPLLDRRVGDAQFTGHLRHWLATRLGQLHGLALQLCCVGLLDLLHDPCPPSETVSPNTTVTLIQGQRL
jgi:hypothetical protein